VPVGNVFVMAGKQKLPVGNRWLIRGMYFWNPDVEGVIVGNQGWIVGKDGAQLLDGMKR